MNEQKNWAELLPPWSESDAAEVASILDGIIARRAKAGRNGNPARLDVPVRGDDDSGNGDSP